MTLSAITQIYGPTDVQMIEYLDLLIRAFTLSITQSSFEEHHFGIYFINQFRTHASFPFISYMLSNV